MVSTSVRYTPEAGVSCLPLASARVLGGRYALATARCLLGGRVRVLLEQRLRHADAIVEVKLPAGKHAGALP